MRRAALATGIVLLGGCDLVLDVGSLTSGLDGSAEGSTDADSNFLTNAGFEETGGGCGPGWNVSNATMNASTNAHSGATSCKVCVVTPGKVASLTASPTPIQKPAIGDTFYAQAWVMVDQDASLSSVVLWINEGYAGGSITKASQNADPKSLAWQELQGRTAPIDDAGTSVGFNVQLFSGDGGAGCVYVDDTALTR